MIPDAGPSAVAQPLSSVASNPRGWPALGLDSSREVGLARPIPLRRPLASRSSLSQGPSGQCLLPEDVLRPTRLSLSQSGQWAPHDPARDALTRASKRGTVPRLVRERLRWGSHEMPRRGSDVLPGQISFPGRNAGPEGGRFATVCRRRREAPSAHVSMRGRSRRGASVGLARPKAGNARPARRGRTDSPNGGVLRARPELTREVTCRTREGIPGSLSRASKARWSSCRKSRSST